MTTEAKARPKPAPPHKALTIAGSDPCGGAGIQADLKTFAALGVYGASALTALTAQNTLGVQAVHDAPPDFVRMQILAVLDDVGADVIKTGMLSSAPIVHAVADALEESGAATPLVVDPVLAAKGGQRLLREEGVAALIDRLLPAATVLTPNSEEAALLTDRGTIRTEKEAEGAAMALLDMGPRVVLLKGGHRGGATCDDLFVERGGQAVWLRGERLDQRHTHGTGCVLSAAIAAYMAGGDEPLEACRRAKSFVAGAIRNALALGHGTGPVNPLWDL
jgi:hydroxymethylpyrimidine kinase/phosphomethylpyrimidine kinase